MKAILGYRLEVLIKKIAKIENMPLALLFEEIEKNSNGNDFKFAVALFCATYFAQSSTLPGHHAAQHGSGKQTVESVLQTMISDKDFMFDKVTIFKDVIFGHSWFFLLISTLQ